MLTMTNQKILSPAILKTYEQCKKKYFLRYVRNILMPQSSIMFERGKNIHALAGYYLTGVNIEKFENSLNLDEKELWTRLKNNKYFQLEPFRAEFPINFRLDGYWFGGRIDGIVKSGQDYFILDYKTGSAPKDPKFDYQTMIYSLALTKYLGNYNSLSFVYIELKKNDNIVVEITKELLIEYSNRLKNIATKISALTENNLPCNKNCKCEYSKICL